MKLESELLDESINDKSKSELVEFDKKLISEIKPRISNLARLKHAEERGKYNTRISKNIENFRSLVGVYQRGKRKGEMKTSLNRLTKKDLIEIARQGRVILRKDVYSTKGRKQKETSARKAFKEFRKLKTKFNPKTGKMETYSFDFTREEFDELTKFFNIVGKDYVTRYGSEDFVNQLYDTIKGENISPYAILGIMDDVFHDNTLNDQEAINEIYNRVYDLVGLD